jgi:hypothetical protein
MINDILFYGSEFYLELPTYSSGTINAPIEWYGADDFELRLALPERISLS